MTYDFSFERKSVAAIVACSVLLCALLFFAGVLAGAGWVAKDDARAAADATKQPPQAGARPVVGAPAAAVRPLATQAAPPTVSYAQPQEPVIYEDPARQEYAAEGYGPRPYDAQPYAGAQAYAAQEGQAYAARDGARRDYAEQGGSAAAQGYAPQRYAARGADGGAQAAAPEPATPPQAAATGRSEAARLSARDIEIGRAHV